MDSMMVVSWVAQMVETKASMMVVWMVAKMVVMLVEMRVAEKAVWLVAMTAVQKDCLLVDQMAALWADQKARQ